jgi:hypothetical protein
MPVQTQMQVRRGTASSWTSTNPTLAAGELGFETDTGKFKIGTGSSTWTALPYAGGGQNTLTTYQYTATAGQTTFSGADINSNTLSYTAGAVQVYLNGALLQNTVDYAASTGTSVVLTAGAGLGDSLTILSLGSFTVSTDIPKSTLTAKGSIIAASGAATPANLSVGANNTVLTADSSEATGLKWAAGAGLTFIASASPSAVSSQSFNNCFSATYQNYLIVMNLLNSAGEDPLLYRMRSSGTDASGSDYDYIQEFVYSTSQLVASTNNATSARASIVAASVQSAIVININRPFDAAPTLLLSNASWYNGNDAMRKIGVGAVHNVSTSYDGITFLTTGGTMTGTIRIYGYSNS